MKVDFMSSVKICYSLPNPIAVEP